MRKKNVIRILRNAGDETVEQLGREYPGLTDTERGDLFERIENELMNVQPEETISEGGRVPVIRARRFSGIFQKTAAAACMLILCGTFAGMIWLRSRTEPPPQPEPTVFSNEEKGRIYSVGERYAAENLTSSGRLWLTVTDTEYDGELYCVSVTLESDNAVSLAGDQTFMLDNIMVATRRSGENWAAVQPCDVTRSADNDSPLYAVFLRPGDKQEVTLRYRLSKLPEKLMLVTSYYSAYSYSVIKEN